ncbi:hypothetical protein OF363_02330 [Mycoplasma enhydrae]|uniref:hypothetical protein n=1 Tax=Mycoplasma enhydrae TaxID=2499220 RepID=UPI0021E89CF2|nr:hypothetical protein [Mycoplasma enhydrae]MCV3733864.1 hypothetical protein [Mycoplasma enhydrae]
MSTFIITLITTFILLIFYHSITLYFLISINKKTAFIENFKIKSKKYILNDFIKLPDKVFNIFDSFIKKSYWFLYIEISIIILFCISLPIALLTIHLSNIEKINSQDLIYVFLYYLLLIEPLWILIINVIKIHRISRVLKDWKKENNKIENTNFEINLPENFNQFKSLILNEDITIKIAKFKNTEKHFFTKKYTKQKKNFFHNGAIDINKLQYFLLFNYEEIYINSTRFDSVYFLSFIKEILNNDTQLN